MLWFKPTAEIPAVSMSYATQYQRQSIRRDRDAHHHWITLRHRNVLHIHLVRHFCRLLLSGLLRVELVAEHVAVIMRGVVKEVHVDRDLF